jgi:O-antigen/teichoic acid export membrane protein
VFSKSVRLTTISAYAQMGVGMLCSLLLIRIATRSLTPEEFGLWSFVFGSIGYFLMLDFGLSYSLGRIFADPIYSGDGKEFSGKFILAIIVLLGQAILIAVLGIMLCEPLLHYFKISSGLREEAVRLWIWCILIYATTLPLNVFPAIIHAQNRPYNANIISAVSQVVNLVVFWHFITQGSGVMAYAYAILSATAFRYIGYILCVFPGRNFMKLTLVRPHFSELPSIMKYSISVFASMITTQASGAAQIMILTRMLGLDAVANYSVSSRVPMLLSSLCMKPFEAHRTEWIGHYCQKETGRMLFSIRKVLQFTIIMILMSIAISMIINPIFVKYWTRSEYFAGTLFNVLVPFAFMGAALGNQLNILFHITKRMKFYTIVTIAGALTEALTSIILVRKIGICGVPVATIMCTGGFVVVFNLIYGRRQLKQAVS